MIQEIGDLNARPIVSIKELRNRSLQSKSVGTLVDWLMR